MFMDYYFSAKGEAAHMASTRSRGQAYVKAYVTINGVEHRFSEQIESGKEPVSKTWGDLEFLGSGLYNMDCRFV